MSDLNSRIKNITTITTFLIQITLCLTIIIGETLVLSDYKKRTDILIAIVIVPLIFGLFINPINTKMNLMKKIIIISFTILVIVLSACTNSNREIDLKLMSLQNENDSLRTELSRLKDLPEACKLMPIPYVKNFNVQQGGDVELFVSMGKIFKGELPKVIIWNEKQKSYCDTFPFNSEFGTNNYIKFPSGAKGKNWIKGKVEFICSGKKTSDLFETMYIVE